MLCQKYPDLLNTKIALGPRNSPQHLGASESREACRDRGVAVSVSVRVSTPPSVAWSRLSSTVASNPPRGVPRQNSRGLAYELFGQTANAIFGLIDFFMSSYSIISKSLCLKYGGRRHFRMALFFIFIGIIGFESVAFSFESTNLQPNGPAATASNLVTHENGVWSSRPSRAGQKIPDLLAVNGIYRFEDYVMWLNKNILYDKRFSSEGWHAPENVFSKRRGDCKDYSLLNYNVLKIFGYDPILLAMKSGNSGHAICAFPKDGRIAFFDNAQLVVSPARSWSEFKVFLARNYHTATLIKIDPVTLTALY